MVIRVVRLGSERAPDEGPRIGTVRRPPRGVPKAQFSTGNWYDLWYPNLAPSVDTMKLGQQADGAADWKNFVRRYRAEMAQAECARSIDLLALFSHHTNFSIGCYCTEEERCHRSILRALLDERGAALVPGGRTGTSPS